MHRPPSRGRREFRLVEPMLAAYYGCTAMLPIVSIPDVWKNEPLEVTQLMAKRSARSPGRHCLPRLRCSGTQYRRAGCTGR